MCSEEMPQWIQWLLYSIKRVDSVTKSHVKAQEEGGCHLAF